MPELSRRVAIDRIGRAGLEIEVTAQAEELPALARRLAVPAVVSLRCRFRLGAVHDGVVDAQGELHAVTSRICVASLEPFDSITQEHFRLRFVPEAQLSDDDAIEAVDEIGYHGAQIDLGDAAVEQLALALDPYPRRDDLPLDGVSQVDAAPPDGTRHDPDAGPNPNLNPGPGPGPDAVPSPQAGIEAPHPFAVLAARGDKSR